MSVGIFIVTYHGDAQWLHYCLRSINVFGSGFAKTVVACPYRDLAVIYPIVEENGAKITGFEEVAGKGFQHHMAIKMMAEQYIDTDYILHTDSDSIFVEAFRPEDYFADGKPILLMQQYDHFITKHPAVYGWKRSTEAALKFPAHFETMRRHPAVHPRAIYPELREHITCVQKRPFLDWALAGGAREWSEFNIMGAYALRNHHQSYHWIDLGREPRPADKIVQFQSRAGFDQVREDEPYAGHSAQQVFDMFNL